uniref:Fatty-acid amide hydrolase 2 n=4 Tax=Lygus hesperus TaxID=30085 RepID=A0A146LKA9_LYGHE
MLLGETTCGLQFIYELLPDDNVHRMGLLVFRCCLWWVQAMTFVVLWPYTKLRTLFMKKQSVPPIANPLLFYSAQELAEKIRTRQVSSVDVVQAYISRTEVVNPIVNAVVQDRFKEALKEAAAVDDEIMRNPDPKYWEIHKPLNGVPISIKESISVAGMSNHAGRRGNRIADSDAPAVSNLRAAGAIPIMVTNTPELCLFWETYNYVRGFTNNPFDSRRTTGGSSGGEAAIIGAGAAPFGLGSDIVGSGRLPPHYCGIFGHKPTPRIISVEGHMPVSTDPEWDTFLVLSPMSSHASDLPLIMKAAAPHASKILCLDEPVDLRELKVFYMEEHRGILTYSVQNEIKQAVHNAAFYFKNMYGIEPFKFTLENFDSGMWPVTVLMCGMKPPQSVLQKSEDPEDWGWKEVIIEIIKAFTGFSKFTIYAVIFCLLQRLVRLLPKSVEKNCRNYKANMIKHFEEILGDNGVLILPVSTATTHLHYRMYYKMSTSIYLAMFNLLEMPSTTVPIGFDKDGLPIGVQVVSTKNNDRLTLAVAKELEKGFGGWLLPRKDTDSTVQRKNQRNVN